MNGENEQDEYVVIHLIPGVSKDFCIGHFQSDDLNDIFQSRLEPWPKRLKQKNITSINKARLHFASLVKKVFDDSYLFIHYEEFVANYLGLSYKEFQKCNKQVVHSIYMYDKSDTNYFLAIDIYKHKIIERYFMREAILRAEGCLGLYWLIRFALIKYPEYHKVKKEIQHFDWLPIQQAILFFDGELWHYVDPEFTKHQLILMSAAYDNSKTIG